MQKGRVFRAMMGGAGLAACIALLAGQAKADTSARYALPPHVEPAIVVTGLAKPASPHIFGTIALPTRAERYHDGWERARREATGSVRLAQLIAPARRLSRLQQLAFVQAAVHRDIRWISDTTEWGAHDYWASAAETLAHGAGDMEDRAIVKMEALKNLGVPARDLYLTLGRDRVGGPAAILLVRVGQRFYVLEDTGGAPFTTEQRPDFEPMVTLGHGGSWIHGRRQDSRGNSGDRQCSDRRFPALVVHRLSEVTAHPRLELATLGTCLKHVGHAIK